jgi:hypothetical protein
MAHQTEQQLLRKTLSSKTWSYKLGRDNLNRYTLYNANQNSSNEEIRVKLRHNRINSVKSKSRQGDSDSHVAVEYEEEGCCLLMVMRTLMQIYTERAIRLARNHQLCLMISLLSLSKQYLKKGSDADSNDMPALLINGPDWLDENMNNSEEFHDVED